MKKEKDLQRKKDKFNTQKLFDYDLSFKSVVGGCDEAGRGPLAGPLVCAACVMPLDKKIEGIDDSKKLSESKRESLYEKIIKAALNFKISIIDCRTIDDINILNATKKGMSEVILNLSYGKAFSCVPEIVLVDAVKPEVNVKTESIIRGDSLSYNIAAASIIAKVTRDRLMREYDKLYPQFNFKQNKGYGTSQHIEALKKHGPTQIHRLSYLKNFFDNVL